MTEPPSSLPFHLETELERHIAADPEWRAGLHYVDRFYGDSPLRERLRLVALIHDTFKHRVERGSPRSGENHHARIARRFAERYIADPSVLSVIELHDEAYNAWQKGYRDGNWSRGEERARALLERLGGDLELYLAFYACDNATGDKAQEPLTWFRKIAERA